MVMFVDNDGDVVVIKDVEIGEEIEEDIVELDIVDIFGDVLEDKEVEEIDVQDDFFDDEEEEGGKKCNFWLCSCCKWVKVFEKDFLIEDVVDDDDQDDICFLCKLCLCCYKI